MALSDQDKVGPEFFPRGLGVVERLAGQRKTLAWVVSQEPKLTGQGDSLGKPSSFPPKECLSFHPAHHVSESNTPWPPNGSSTQQRTNDTNSTTLSALLDKTGPAGWK